MGAKQTVIGTATERKTSETERDQRTMAYLIHSASDTLLSDPGGSETDVTDRKKSIPYYSPQFSQWNLSPAR